MRKINVALSSLVLCLAFASVVVAQTSTIDFVPPVRVGSSVTVQGVIGDKVSVSSWTAPPKCEPDFNTGTTLTATPVVLTNSQQLIPISPALTGGDAGTKWLCLRSDHVDADGVSRQVYSPNAIGVLPALAVLDFVSVPMAGTSTIDIQLTNAVAADLFVFEFPADYAGGCARADILGGSATSLTLGPLKAASQTISSTAAQTIQLSEPLKADHKLCLLAMEKSPPPPPAYSPLTKVTPTPRGSIKFTTDLVAGLGTFSFVSDTSGNVSVFMFNAGYHPKGSTSPSPSVCKDSDLEFASPLPLVGSGANATVSTVQVTANQPQTVTLSGNNTLVAGTQICLYESTGPGIPNSAFSNFKPVNFFAPGDDYGRFTITMTGGALISNQQQSTNSSTASEYIDVALGYTLARSGSTQPVKYRTPSRGPGLQTFLDGKLVSVPVTSTNTNVQTPAPGSGNQGATTLTQSLNALSSQQSIRVLGGIYAPFRLTRWYGRTNWITLAPLAVAGFDTLLNPTAPASPASSVSVLNTTTADFGQVYNYHAVGARLGWEVYSNSTDEAPRDLAWISATLGDYSNLPSYVCTLPANAPSIPAGTYYFTDTASPATSCLVQPASGPAPYSVFARRKVLPRLDFAGELALPSFPIVIGMDANLGQYKIDGGGVDIQNKPGSDVRIYFGLKLDITKALSKLGVSTSQ